MTTTIPLTCDMTEITAAEVKVYADKIIKVEIKPTIITAIITCK